MTPTSGNSRVKILSEDNLKGTMYMGIDTGDERSELLLSFSYIFNQECTVECLCQLFYNKYSSYFIHRPSSTTTFTLRDFCYKTFLNWLVNSYWLLLISKFFDGKEFTNFTEVGIKGKQITV